MALFELSAINLLDFVTKFIPDNAKENQEHQKAGILFRTLYAECVNNIQILDAFKRESFAKEDTFRAVKAIAPLLKNDVGQIILLGTDGSLKELDVLQNQIEMYNLEDEDFFDSEIKTAKTVRQAISFCVNKIQFLKNYAQIEEENLDLFKELTLKTRLNNIYNFSKQIKKQLYEYLPSMFE